MRRTNSTLIFAATAAFAVYIPQLARAQASESADGSVESASGYVFKSRSDSISWAHNRSLAAKATGFHLVVSLEDRHIWAIVGHDTVLSAPAAVAKGTTLDYGKSTWKFETPRGIRTV